MTKVFGIDVSEFNGKLDFAKLKAQGVKFVIIRAGYGQVATQIDKEFKSNISGAMSNGLDIGIYWFSYAYSAKSAETEAEIVAKICEPYKKYITLPVFFDWEYDSQKYCVQTMKITPSKDRVTEWTLAFVNKLKSLGYTGGYYTNEDYYSRYYDAAKMKGVPLWIAYYVDKKPEKYDCLIQQYKSDGKISGFSGNFDLDYWYKEEATQATPATPQKEEAKTKMVDITYKDVLNIVAQKYGSTVDALAKLNGISNTSTVYARFKVPAKTLDDLAKEVIAGKWGSGLSRYTKITNAYKNGEIAYTYAQIQNRVNQLMKK